MKATRRPKFNELVSMILDSSSDMTIEAVHRNANYDLGQEAASQILTTLKLSNPRCVQGQDGLLKVGKIGDFGTLTAVCLNSNEVSSPRIYNLPMSFGLSEDSVFSQNFRTTLDSISNSFRVQNGESGEFRDLSSSIKTSLYEAVMMATLDFMTNPFVTDASSVAFAYRTWLKSAELIVLASSQTGKVRVVDLRNLPEPTSMKFKVLSPSRLGIWFDNQVAIQARVHNGDRLWTETGRVPIKVSFEMLKA